ncbi:4Fe-4S ferredoxin N-terminal domain-containing protein [Halovivax gelatinilyticus]|uniref:4Fe-4S ferredoxin N-terminal domain-containing protein n=1 Tax=Halovivax gelatinilyticus TaxID=2961597 RepID=UPI0020CA8C52|nr:4Fe-4S ferredoxin N-terminal domain-containing protein [Halovivax gelatinilyticus]
MSTNTEDESFHPLGEEWESELTSMLDDTEYDTDLGLAMAEDAQRLVAGELTEAEFHEKYHDDVMAEFGEDERPTAEAYEEAQEGGGLLDALASLKGDDEQSRRDVMKKMGVGGAFLGMGALTTAEDGVGDGIVQASEDERDGTQWGMTIDLEVCDGCLSCVQACGEENNLDQGVNWMYVLAYEDSNVSVPDDPDGPRDYPFLVRPCQHCTDAPCEKVCPTTARHTRSKDGLVLTDYDVCIGCRYCQVACPYGVNYFQWGEPDISDQQIVDQMNEEMGMDVERGEPGDHIVGDYSDYADGDEHLRRVDSRAPRGVMSKCTFCPTRQDGFSGDEMVGTTACQQACPPGAIQFGDVNDPASDASLYAEYPALGRAIEDLFGRARMAPTPEDVEEGLEEIDADEDDVDMDVIVEEAEIMDYEELALVRAIVVLTDDLEIDDYDRPRAMADDIEAARELVDALEDAGVDFEDERVRRVLRTGDESPDDAEAVLQGSYGSAESTFKLLEDIGTNPNVTYIGNEPGPSAEQVPGPVAYDSVTYDRADGSEPALVDNRKDVLDEETVRGI